MSLGHVGAVHLGQIVMAVPGPVTSLLSVGCHLLVRDEHAVLVTRVAEVIETVGGWVGCDRLVPGAMRTRRGGA